MSSSWDKFFIDLSKKSGYSYCFLVDRFDEMMEDEFDFEQYVRITMERDW